MPADRPRALLRTAQDGHRRHLRAGFGRSDRPGGGLGIGFGLGVLSLCGLLLATATWLWRHAQRAWSVVGLAAALALLTVPPTSGMQPYGTLWLYAAVTSGYVVISALMGRIRRCP